MEESISGFKHRGSWGDIVEHGERITRALHDAGVDNEAFEEWNEWRPKSHERMGEDIKEKTAAQAHVAEGKGEQAGESPGEDLQTAGEKLAESYENLDEPEEAVGKWGESIDYVARAADSAGRKAMRKVEDTVYKNVMTQMSPYYFDNDLISANLQRVGRGEGGEYVFEVNVNDDDLKIRVSNKLADFDSEVDRWHVNTEKETASVEAAEGVDAPEDDDEPDAKTN